MPKTFAVLAVVCLAPACLAAQSLDEARELHIAGQYRAALEAYDRVAEALTQTDPSAAATAHNNACVIHNGFGEYEAAREQCRRSLALRRELDDPRRLARTLNNLAIAEQSLGEYEAARRSFGEALEINRQREDAFAQVLNLSNLGALATVSGRYAEALDLHRRASELAAAHADEPWSAEQLQVATINRGVVLEHLGAYREALELYRELVDSEPEAMGERRRAQLKLNSGVLYRNLGDPRRAVAEFEEVAAIYRRLEDPDGLSNALLNLALALDLNLERWDEAEDAYRQALDLAAQHEDRPEEIRDLFYLGRFLAARGRAAEAEEVYRRCLAVAGSSGSAEGRWAALAGLGRIAAERGDHRTAAERFSGAIGEIEVAGAGLAEPGLRSGFFGDRRSVYAEAAQAWAELDRLEPEAGHEVEAFAVAQRAKARALLDTLGNRQWTATPLAAAEVGQRLARPLVEYFAAGQDLLRWSIGPAGLEMSNLGPHGPVREAALALYRQLEAGAAPDPDTLTSLSTTLLAGLDLANLEPGSLHIATDGLVDRLPFELLPLPGRDADRLADRFAVSYVPSASTLVWLRERRGRNGKVGAAEIGMRGFADPRLALADRDSASGLLAARFALAPLPAAAEGLGALARGLSGRAELFVGEAATEAEFRARASSAARVVHLATHAVIDERPGRGAAILLTPGDGHDGLLEPLEIAALPQRTELTVLAACRSALDAGSGGALSTLAGAFLAGGSSAVVATLWDVGDAATAVFMEQFYHQLGRGQEPAAALRQAKRALRSDSRWSAPHLWSGYVLIGEASPVEGRRGPWWPVVVIGVLVAVGVLLVLRRRS